MILHSKAHPFISRYKNCLFWNQFCSLCWQRPLHHISWTVYLPPICNSLSRLAFISWTLVSFFPPCLGTFFTPGSSLGVSGGNGHKYASHTTSLLASHTWNGLLLSFFKKSKASKSLSTLFYERKESLWNDLVSWFKPLQSALLVHIFMRWIHLPNWPDKQEEEKYILSPSFFWGFLGKYLEQFSTIRLTIWDDETISKIT